MATWANSALNATPLAFDFSSWFAMRSRATLVLFAMLAAWGSHLALAGKPAVGGALLDEGETV